MVVCSRLCRFGASCRASRILVLLLGVVLLSLADLIVTMYHLCTLGMMEANPVAAYLIQATNSPWILVGFKLLTVTIAVGALWYGRDRLLAELGAWLSVAGLAFIAFAWHQYADCFDDLRSVQFAQAELGPDQWLYFHGSESPVALD